MTTATQTAKKEKFVKYWVHEEAKVIATINNEIRFFPQHGKVQVYPKVSTERAAHGIGKGATINFDTFTKMELSQFKVALEQLYDNAIDGFEIEKKYWLNEEPHILSTEKNEIRFFEQHGKLQVFPKVESSKSGIGRGATINFEGLDMTDIESLVDGMNSIISAYRSSPDFTAPTPPPAPVNVLAKEEPVQEQTTDIDSLLAKMIKHVDPSVAAQLQALLNGQIPEAEEPKSEPLKLGKEMIEVPIESELTEDEIIARGVDHHMSGWILENTLQAYHEGGKEEAVKYMKKWIGIPMHGFSRLGVRGSANAQGVEYHTGINSKKYKLNWNQVWDKFAELHPELLVVTPTPAVVEPQPNKEDIDEEFETYGDEDMVDESFDSEEVINNESNDEEQQEPKFTADPLVVIGKMIEATPDVEPTELSGLTNLQLLNEFEINTNIEVSKYNPIYTVALFEEIKYRKSLGKLK
ncbi:hypothetical protein [Peribacillus frigoritolerans]|uniref:Uncharacterized protein n=1 Tax=Peribacillus castrilensis TaxID=2897690 RepID=A0AAW9NL77_9BACI|nr:hypothetical protein [Peribacillus castrilensis]